MDTLYPIILAVHNLLRWIIVVLSLVVIFKTYQGWFTKSIWVPSIQKLSTYFTIALDSQLLVGFILYFVFSPLSKALFADFSAAMSNPTLRFYGLEHPLLMIIAIALAHIGSSTGKKDLPDNVKYRRAAIFFTLSILAIIFAIPWEADRLLPSL